MDVKEEAPVEMPISQDTTPTETTEEASVEMPVSQDTTTTEPAETSMEASDDATEKLPADEPAEGIVVDAPSNWADMVDAEQVSSVDDNTVHFSICFVMNITEIFE